MKTWASSPAKVRENHINAWRNINLKKFDFYIVCDEDGVSTDFWMELG